MLAAGKMIVKEGLAYLKMKVGSMTADGGDRGLKEIFNKANDAYKTHTIHSRSPLTQQRIDLPFKDVDYPEFVPPVLSISENLPNYLLVIPVVAAAACYVAYQISSLIYLALASRFQANCIW